jgi:hypothetical protein
MGLKAGWLALFMFVWLVGAFLGSTFEFQNTADTWAGSGTGGYDQSPQSTIEYLIDVTNSFQKLPFFNITIPIPTNQQYWEAAFKVITWRWAFMEDYDMIYWLFCAPFVAMGVLSLILIAYGIITGNLSWS